MQIRYDSDADVLTLQVRGVPPYDAIEEAGGIIISYGEDKEPVSVEFLNASERGILVPGELSVPLKTV